MKLTRSLRLRLGAWVTEAITQVIFIQLTPHLPLVCSFSTGNQTLEKSNWPLLSVLVNTNTQKNATINLYIQIQLKIILKDIFPPRLRKPSHPSICPHDLFCLCPDGKMPLPSPLHSLLKTSLIWLHSPEKMLCLRSPITSWDSLLSWLTRFCSSETCLSLTISLVFGNSVLFSSPTSPVVCTAD